MGKPSDSEKLHDGLRNDSAKNSAHDSFGMFEA